MQSGTHCPQCGRAKVDGACPLCSAPRPAGLVPPDSLVWEYLIVVTGAVFLTLLWFGSHAIANHRRTVQHAAKILAMRRGSPVARRDQLTGSGRIYLVQMGAHEAPYSLNEFADWLRTKYALDVQILPPVALDESAWDSQREQYIAELLTEELKRQHAQIAADPHAYLIGFTDADMYLVNSKWNSAFTWRDGARTAVISAAGMQDGPWQRMWRMDRFANQHFHARLRRILLKDVASLYWHLPLNNDPASLLQDPLDPDIPLEDIYESDLDPEQTRWGRSEQEPCMFFAYSAKDGIKNLPGPLIRSCSDLDGLDVVHDESVEIFEVDLRLGLLIDKHTDFYLPGSVPIQFVRATRDGWSRPMGFGISGTHNYDNFLGCDVGMHTIQIYRAEGGTFNLRRTPSWLATLSLVKYVDSDYSGHMAEMRWRGDRFHLHWYNGDAETFLPCAPDTPPCYEIAYRNAKGGALVYKRDAHRKLTRLEAPNNLWLNLSYDQGARIAEIRDSRGRSVSYAYDDRGRLVRVAYPSGEVLYYEYDNSQHLLTFAAASSASAQPVVLLRNHYEQGRPSMQSFADGRSYQYSYESGNDGGIRSATVRTPEGAIFEAGINEEGGAAIRERADGRSAQPKP